MKLTQRISLGLAVSLAAALPAQADTITKTDGSVLDSVTIEDQTLTEVTYKEGRDSGSVPADQVRSVSFERYPTDVDEALGFLSEGDLFSALQYLDAYVDDEVEKPSERKYKWAPAYAAYRALDLRMQVYDLPGVVSAAKRLISNFPDSRYVPIAFLYKASAENAMNKGSEAGQTLTGMSELVSSRQLSKRWELECRLAQIRYDSSKFGAAQRADLATVSKEAGSQFPTVKNRARVAEGESYVGEAEKTQDASKSMELRTKAQRIFQEVAKDAKADDEALAGSFTGLGDCLFFSGAASGDEAILRSAAQNYLRVVVNYEAQSEYVAKSLFYAMRCFELIGQRSRQNDMRRELLALYPDTSWATRPEVQRN